MIDGRVVAGERDLGTGFCLTDRVVATAAHVVRGRAPSELVFVTGSGIVVPIDRIDLDPATDVAMLWITRSLTIVPALADVVPRTEWRVAGRPRSNDPQLSGTVTAVDHLIENASGFEVSVLQLHVHQEMADFGGYSGSAVTVDGAVVGILVEQVAERLNQSGQARRSANVLYAVPVQVMVRQFQLPVPVMPAHTGLPPLQQLLDTAYFDLDVVKSAILNTKSVSDGRLLGLGLACPETVVVRKLCDWLPPYVGDLECKDWINLNPAVTSVGVAVKSVKRYLADLGRVNVVCPVLVDGVPAPIIAQFWNEVQAHCGQTAHWLVLLFAGDRDASYPPTVTSLPQPRFEHADIAAWARDMTAFRRWPSRLADVWAELLVEQASDGNELSIRFTYEALQDSIRRVRQEPDSLRHQLEERRRR